MMAAYSSSADTTLSSVFSVWHMSSSSSPKTSIIWRKILMPPCCTMSLMLALTKASCPKSSKMRLSSCVSSRLACTAFMKTCMPCSATTSETSSLVHSLLRAAMMNLARSGL